MLARENFCTVAMFAFDRPLYIDACVLQESRPLPTPLLLSVPVFVEDSDVHVFFLWLKSSALLEGFERGLAPFSAGRHKPTLLVGHLDIEDVVREIEILVQEHEIWKRLLCACLVWAKQGATIIEISGYQV